MNTDLEFVPVPPAELDRIRSNGIDDYGNPFTVQTTETGPPLRCLTLSTVGEQAALIAYRASPFGGPYAEVGPVFVQAEPCRGFAGDIFPADFRERRAVLRPYDADGLMLDGIVAEPGTSEGS